MNMYYISNKGETYFVCANTPEEAEDIGRIGMKLSGKIGVPKKPMPYVWDLEGDPTNTQHIIGGLPTGYFDCKSQVTVLYGAGKALWFPFVPCNLRQHYIDIALAALET